VDVSDEVAALVRAARTRVLEAINAPGYSWGQASDLDTYAEVKAVLGAPAEVRAECAVAASQQDAGWLLIDILKVPTTLSAAQLAAVLTAVLPAPRGPRDDAPADVVKALAGQIEAVWASLDPEGRAHLGPYLARASAVDNHALATRLRALLATGIGDRVPYELFDDADEVGKELRAALAASAEGNTARSALLRLLAGFPAKGKPDEDWQDEAAAVLGRLHDPVALVKALLEAVLAAGDHEYQYNASYMSSYFIRPRNEAIACGLAAFASRAAKAAGGDAAQLLPLLRKLALKAVDAQSGGSRSIRLMNHCVQAIADAGLPSSLTELLHAERGTRHGSLRYEVRKALESVAAAQGMGPDELLERGVEDHGLGAGGTRAVSLGEGWLAVLAASGRSAEISYLGPDGKPRKALPKDVKAAAADVLSALQKDMKAVRATVANERARIDGLLAAGRTWDLALWRELYLDHPVTGRATRALIWTFRLGDRGVTGIPLDRPAGDLAVLAADGSQAIVPGGATVALWHPVQASADEVRAWRQLLLNREIIQPVKQAFREVYLLTPAEEATRDYSNRFAGHVFGQVQARALMKGRGWSAAPLAWGYGMEPGVARREFRVPGAALRASFFFDHASDETSGELYAYVASDQVRFFDAATGDGVPLAEVPALVFTEAMRDVDLVIGVTSIGNDPEWLDRGEGRRLGEVYWREWGFGVLSASAQIRREVLQQLVPKLAIADRCTLEPRFLVVRGDLRTYKIHLGSGNILMAPNDQYLCIVPARGVQPGTAFLPFDDDRVLSLILSKAFLLAADAKIADPAITSQIGRGRPM
jgi:hypothetical protein